MFNALIETFKKHLPTWHRYWKVRKQALKLDEFHVYDIKAPLSENSPKSLDRHRLDLRRMAPSVRNMSQPYVRAHWKTAGWTDPQ